MKPVTRGSLWTHYLDSASSILSGRWGGSENQNNISIQLLPGLSLHDYQCNHGALAHAFGSSWAQFTGLFFFKVALHPWSRGMSHHSPSLHGSRSYSEGEDLSFCFIFSTAQKLLTAWPWANHIETLVSNDRLMGCLDSGKKKSNLSRSQNFSQRALPSWGAVSFPMFLK